MRAKPIFVLLLVTLSLTSNAALAESYLGYYGTYLDDAPRQPRHLKRSPVIESLPVQTFKRTKGHRPPHQNYDLDFTTGDDNPYVSPDLQIN